MRTHAGEVAGVVGNAGTGQELDEQRQGKRSHLVERRGKHCRRGRGERLVAGYLCPSRLREQLSYLRRRRSEPFEIVVGRKLHPVKGASEVATAGSPTILARY